MVQERAVAALVELRLHTDQLAKVDSQPATQHAAGIGGQIVEGFLHPQHKAQTAEGEALQRGIDLLAGLCEGGILLGRCFHVGGF